MQFLDPEKIKQMAELMKTTSNTSFGDRIQTEGFRKVQLEKSLEIRKFPLSKLVEDGLWWKVQKEMLSGVIERN